MTVEQPAPVPEPQTVVASEGETDDEAEPEAPAPSNETGENGTTPDAAVVRKSDRRKRKFKKYDDFVIPGATTLETMRTTQALALRRKRNKIAAEETATKSTEAPVQPTAEATTTHEETAPRSPVYLSTLCCSNCGSSEHEDEMLLCDACDSGYHMKCLHPPRKKVPKGNWYCPKCKVEKKAAPSPRTNGTPKKEASAPASKSAAHTVLSPQHISKTDGMRFKVTFGQSKDNGIRSTWREQLEEIEFKAREAEKNFAAQRKAVFEDLLANSIQALNQEGNAHTPLLIEAMEISNQRVKDLEKDKQYFKTQTERLERELRREREEVHRLKEDKDRLQSDKDKQLAEKDKIFASLEKSIEERDALQREKEKVYRDAQRFQREGDKAQLEQERLREENKRLKEERDRYKAEKGSLEVDNEKLASEKQLLLKNNNDLQSQLERDMARLRRELETLATNV
jgi:hypothetical protein